MASRVRTLAIILWGAFYISLVAADAEDEVKVSINGEDSIASGLKFFLRLYDDCSRKDGLSPCLKMKAITFFDRAMRSHEIPLTDSLVLVKAQDAQGRVPVGRSLTETELEESLPRSNAEEKDFQLNQMLIERVAKFFNNYKVQIAFPKMEGNELQRSIEEGRGKMKKMMGMMMMGVAMKMAAVVPMVLGVLLLIAGKALIISKIALVLSLIIALKKLLSQKGGGGHDMHHGGGWQSGGGGGGGGWDRRSLGDLAAQEMAYSAQIPNAIQSTK